MPAEVGQGVWLHLVDELGNLRDPPRWRAGSPPSMNSPVTAGMYVSGGHLFGGCRVNHRGRRGQCIAPGTPKQPQRPAVGCPLPQDLRIGNHRTTRKPPHKNVQDAHGADSSSDPGTRRHCERMR